MNQSTCMKLKELMEKKSPAYTVSFDGRIVAMSDIPITNDEAKELGIGRSDAFRDFDVVMIPEDQANILLDAMDAIVNNDLDGFNTRQLEAIEYLRDAVDHTQYQATANWIEDYIKNAPRNPDGSFKID